VGELPHIKALVQRHDSSKFAVVGINTDKDPEMFRTRSEKDGVTWDNIFNGSTNGGIPAAWGVSGYPMMYVLDGSGTIRSISPRGDNLEKVVDELVAEAKQAVPTGN
jgi:hypothetical protein